ncbi:TonB-dependent receptor [Paraglaciecola aquimarina]|uniref:TonB-dependent receptor n=1 Tax=Paraglaciecola algarum TaxID=3050085 RepID=A0ABS9DAZ4_9ALTE|nr:TonB-dependent receptor [Paraglaciecola sp. G1-23]MCF2950099.1 TonB-dependent receptor [Paraglaciecola sp. G1-23]
MNHSQTPAHVVYRPSQLFGPLKTLLAKSIALAVSCSILSSSAFSQDSYSQDTNTDDGFKFEVIEVTSQKRVQNVMQVPITVGIINADLLEESSSIGLADVDKFIPGFDFSDANVTQAGVKIRGVSSPNISVGGDPSAATFYDDVYMPRAAQNVVFSDIERVEVLKGPQGTLFGRNAATGVVSIIPKKPSDDTEGFGKFSWGTDNLQRYEGMANVALSNNLYLRVNGLVSLQDGIVQNTAKPEWNKNNKIWDLGDKNHKAARIALLWDISTGTEFQLSLDLDDLNQAPPMAIGLSAYASHGGTQPFASYTENDVRKGVESRDMYGVTAKFIHEFDDNWSMKYVASVRDWQTVNREDEDGTADITRYFDTSNNEDSDIFYTELQFNCVSARVSAVTGFSYSKENVTQTSELNITTDAVARIVTQDLNNEIRGGVAQQIAAAIGGTSDEITQAVFGPGVTFDAVVDSQFSELGLPMDHLWNPGEWASALNALGYGSTITAALGMPGADLNDGLVLLAGDAIYEVVSQTLGVPEIFGPSHSGQFWQESVNNTGTFTNWGAFADVDFAINDKWHVIAGLRYSNDEKDFAWYIPETSYAAVRPGVSNQLFPQVDISATDSWSKVTGRLVTNYQINDDNFVFASYSTGYKSGGFDSLTPISQADGQEAFAPEDVANFELGYKGILSDSFITNISYYQMELDNFQVAVESKQPGSTTAVSTIINENRSINGIEIDAKWNVSDAITVGIVTDFRNTDADRPSFYNAEGELLDATSTSSDNDTNYTATLDWFPDSKYGAINVHIDYVFVENTNAQRSDILPFQLAIPEYLSDRKNLSARISLSTNDDSMEMAFWGRNLLNERYIEGISNLTRAFFGTSFARINRGREIGMDFKYNF